MERPAENGVGKRRGKPRNMKRRKKRNENWHITLGDRLIQQGKYQQAMAEYNKALKILLD